MQICYPLANSPVLTVEQWSKMAQHYVGTGFVKDLGAYADSTGMQVKVSAGQAFIQGHFYESDVVETLAIGPADATNPRIDRVIIRLDWTTSVAQLSVLQGTPAVTPTAPALTQNSNRWEITVAQVRVNAGVATIASSDITDERNYFNVNIKDSNGDGIYYAFNEDEHNGYISLKSRNVPDSTQRKVIYTATPDGVLTLPNQPYVSVAKTTTTSLATGVWTKIIPNTEYQDVNNNFGLSDGRFNAPDDGVYLLAAYFNYTAQPTGYVNFRIMKDGEILTTMKVSRYESVSSALRAIQFVKGSYYEFYFMLEGPTTLTLEQFNMTIEKIA